MIHAVSSLDTSRLRLRQPAASDLDAYASLCADPEVMRYVGDRGPLSREDAWRQLAMLVGHWALRGNGMWVVEELGSGAFVGRVGLHYPEGFPEPEVAWAIARPYWGRGYAFEAATAALRIAFDERFERNLIARGHEVSLYAIERRHWRDHGGGPATSPSDG